MTDDKKATRLTPLDGTFDSVKLRVQENIYGHRFTTDQEPYMILLEALNVCAERSLGDEGVDQGSHEKLTYGLKQRRKMRYLLFVDRSIDRVALNQSIPDHQKWNKWKSQVNKLYKEKYGGDNHFDYLDSVFDKNIMSLAQAIRVLRSQELDVSNRRRWTSRFLAVKGPDMICSDFRERNWSRDRRFFARGGELVYLMLNRSKHAEDIMKEINNKFLNIESPMNRLCEAISEPKTNIATSHGDIGYLPLTQHSSYNRMAKDWLRILTTEKLPDSQLFDPLFRITGLNLVSYFALRAQEILGEKKPEPIVIDAKNGSDIQLRELAKIHLSRHRDVSNRAVESFIKDVVNENGWEEVGDNPRAAFDIIKDKFLGKNAVRDLDYPERQIQKLIKEATSRDKNNIHKVLLPLTKGIGLVTARSGSGTWFSLSDSMIAALVLANVHKSDTIELSRFVKKIYKNYKIVIGPNEAKKAYGTPPVGLQKFRDNLAALESRMTKLSLTFRLSDDCAFVVNPYR